MPLDKHKLLSIVSRLQPLLDQEEDADIRKLKTKCYTELDELFWDFVLEEMLGSVQSDGSGFDLNRTARAVINSGLLSEDVLVDPPAGFTETVFNEILVTTEAPLFHLADWLMHRAQESALLKFNELLGARARDESSDVFKDEEVIKLREIRDGLYKHAGQLFRNLPGITSQATELVATGRLDDQIDALTASLCLNPDDPSGAQMDKLLGLRKRFMQLAAMRGEEKHARILDGLGKLHLKMTEAIQRATKDATSRADKERSEEWQTFAPGEYREVLKREIPMLRRLWPLGATDSGIRNVHAVLHSLDVRVPAARVQQILEIIAEYDPYLPGQPDVVLAPFRGIGFYEWDHNAIFVPLVCTRYVDETIVHAVASYRLTEDALSGRYKIINPYKERFGKGEFRARFVRDYSAWILGVGKGLRGAMSDESYQFFKRTIGPNPEIGIFPREIMTMGREAMNNEIRDLRKLLARNPDLQDERLRLTALLWYSGRVQLAFENLQLLYKNMPANGKIALAYGMVCIRLGYREEARQILKRCIENAPQSLWQVYANEFLSQL